MTRVRRGPARERLDAHHLARLRAVLRLKVDVDRPRSRSPRAGGGHRQPREAVVVALAGVATTPALAALGLVHGDVGSLHQRLEVAAVLGYETMPMLASIANPTPAISIGSAMLSRSPRRSRAPARAARRRGSRTRRRRAARRCRSRAARAAGARADLDSTWSPVWWPSVSLISLKRSRSISMIETLCAARLASAQRDLGAVAEHHAVRQVGQRVLEREALADDRLAPGAVDRDERQDRAAAAPPGCSRWRARLAVRCRAGSPRCADGTQIGSNCRRSGISVCSEITIATAPMLKT